MQFLLRKLGLLDDRAFSLFYADFSRVTTSRTMTVKLRCIWLLSFLILWMAGAGCSKRTAHEVVLYTSWDAPHSRPVLDLFEERTGIKVKAVYDTEAAKTAGLVNRLIAEKRSPRADVFWNSEIVRTLVLKENDVLQPYIPRESEIVPETFKDVDGYWTGFAGRCRILLYNTERVQNPPRTMSELTDPRWKGDLAIANPLFGTTATDTSVLFSSWGNERTVDFFNRLKRNEVKIAAGNGMVRDMVSRGEVGLGLTDTDDALGAIAAGHPVKIVFLDQGESGEGALLIPNTVCLINDAPNPDNGKRLIDFLVSSEVSAMLANSRAGQIPLVENIDNIPESVDRWSRMKFRHADFEAAHANLEDAMRFVRESFLE